MKIKKINIDGEIVNLKRGAFGYRVVHPIRDDGSKLTFKNIFDGNTNWINLVIGGRGNFFKLLFILLIIGLVLFGVNEMVKSCREMAKNPCDYCYQTEEFQSKFSSEILIYNGSFEVWKGG